MRAQVLLVGVTAASAIASSIPFSGREEAALPPIAPAAVKLPVEGELPSFAGATLWLNSEPLTGAGLRGKVVLVEFWTFTCINWLRQLPYVRAWAEKYGDSGLVVIGVHTPEFEFEKVVDDVRRAAKDLRVHFPIAVDSDGAIWRAFGNQYWFHARDLHLVMGPPARGTSARFRVLVDGQPPGAARGADVDEQGHGTASGQRLYQLIRQAAPIADRRFEIEFLDPGVEVFAFTFG